MRFISDIFRKLWYGIILSFPTVMDLSIRNMINGEDFMQSELRLSVIPNLE